MRGFQAFLRGQQLVVALESGGSKTMNRKMQSTSQGEFECLFDCGETDHLHQRSNEKTTPVKIPETELIIGTRNQTSNATASRATNQLVWED
jgi:hypothetical protein